MPWVFNLACSLPFFCHFLTIALAVARERGALFQGDACGLELFCAVEVEEDSPGGFGVA